MLHLLYLAVLFGGTNSFPAISDNEIADDLPFCEDDLGNEGMFLNIQLCRLEMAPLLSKHY